MNWIEFAIVIPVVLIGVSLYLVPTIISGIRQHRNANAILIVNLFLGWSFIGWVAALVWAMTDNVERRQKRTRKSRDILADQIKAERKRQRREESR